MADRRSSPPDASVEHPCRQYGTRAVEHLDHGDIFSSTALGDTRWRSRHRMRMQLIVDDSHDQREPAFYDVLVGLLADLALDSWSALGLHLLVRYGADAFCHRPDDLSILPFVRSAAFAASCRLALLLLHDSPRPPICSLPMILPMPFLILPPSSSALCRALALVAHVELLGCDAFNRSKFQAMRRSKSRRRALASLIGASEPSSVGRIQAFSSDRLLASVFLDHCAPPARSDPARNRAATAELPLRRRAPWRARARARGGSGSSRRCGRGRVGWAARDVRRSGFGADTARGRVAMEGWIRVRRALTPLPGAGSPSTGVDSRSATSSRRSFASCLRCARSLAFHDDRSARRWASLSL